jgi:hypothetical protein
MYIRCALAALLWFVPLSAHAGRSFQSPKAPNSRKTNKAAVEQRNARLPDAWKLLFARQRRSGNRLVPGTATQMPGRRATCGLAEGTCAVGLTFA